MNINIIILKQIDILAFQSKIKIDNYDIIVFIEIRIKNRVIIHFILSRDRLWPEGIGLPGGSRWPLYQKTK